MGILTEEMQRTVREQRLGFVATVCPDGTPNLSPKGTTAVWDGNHLYFADIASPGTVANLRHNSAIAINVVSTITRRGYRFKGTAEVITDGPLFEQMTERRGRDVLPKARGFVLVTVTEAAEVWSPAYDSGRSEADVRTQWLDYWDSLYRPAADAESLASP